MIWLCWPRPPDETPATESWQVQCRDAFAAAGTTQSSIPARSFVELIMADDIDEIARHEFIAALKRKGFREVMTTKDGMYLKHDKRGQIVMVGTQDGKSKAVRL